jgi:hypothetical protein
MYRIKTQPQFDLERCANRQPGRHHRFAADDREFTAIADCIGGARLQGRRSANDSLKLTGFPL